VSLQAPQTVQKLQATLYAKAKGAPSFRFYSLYDKIYREDVLKYAYRCGRQKRGTPGVDGMSFGEIERRGVERWLGALAEELKERTYRPEAVKRVRVPKREGGERALGIPTVKDRVIQTAAVIVLGPIFEADLPEEQYAYRPGRSAHDAIIRVHRLINRGYREVVEADLRGYFDEIPHRELIKSLARRISDGAVLKLLKQWMEMPVEEEREEGGTHRSARNRKTRKGIPQGSPISPLLANIYMRRFILGWRKRVGKGRDKGEVVNYADDLVICCRRGGEEALRTLNELMIKLKLAINERKTRVCYMPRNVFDFLGYTVGRCYSPRTGESYLGTRPSRGAIKRVCRQISELTTVRWTPLPADERVRKLNSILRGWGNYFRLGPVSKAYKGIDAHTRKRLRQWLCAKHKIRGRGLSRFPDEYLYQNMGLYCLEKQTRNFPWAKAECHG